MNKQIKINVAAEDFKYDSNLKWYQNIINNVSFSVICEKDDLIELSKGVEYINNIFNYHSISELITYFKSKHGLSWHEEEDIEKELSVDQYIELIELESIGVDGEKFNIWFTDGYCEDFDGLYYGHGLNIKGTKEMLTDCHL